MSFDNAEIIDLDPAALDSLFGTAPADAAPIVDQNMVSTFEDQPNLTTGDIAYYDGTQDAVEDDSLEPEEIPTLTAEEKAAKEEADRLAAEATTPETETPATIEEDTVAVNTVLKNTVDYLITSGQWQDFEGREELEMTQEVYAELAAKQNQESAYQIVNELVNSTGDYGKAIISHIKKGGNPDEIIDLFKEQKELQAIDTSSEEGKQFKIEKYYKEVLKWKPEKVEKTIKRLITENEIESEFTDINDLYDAHYEEKLSQINEQATQKEEKAKQRQEEFVTNIKSALNDSTDLSEADKKLISSSILDFKHKLDNGTTVSNFYLKFYELQSNPKEYIDLVQYVLDPKGYKEKISKKEESKAAKKTFEFIKGNAVVTKSGSNPIVQKQTPVDNTKAGTNFSIRK